MYRLEIRAPELPFKTLKRFFKDTFREMHLGPSALTQAITHCAIHGAIYKLFKKHDLLDCADIRAALDHRFNAKDVDLVLARLSFEGTLYYSQTSYPKMRYRY